MTSKRKWNSSTKWGSVTVFRQDITVYRVTHPIATCHWNLTGHSGNPWETLHCSRSLAVCPLSPLVQPPLTAGSALHSDQVPEGYTQLGLEKFQGKRLHNLSGQPVGLPVLMGNRSTLHSVWTSIVSIYVSYLLSSHPSQNHWMAAAGRDHWRSASPTSLPPGKEIPQPLWATSSSPQSPAQ